MKQLNLELYIQNPEERPENPDQGLRKLASMRLRSRPRILRFACATVSARSLLQLSKASFSLSAFSSLAIENVWALKINFLPPLTLVCESDSNTRPFLTISSVTSPGTTFTR